MVVVPTVEWIRQDPTIDPSGFRDVKTTGFLKNLDTGAAGVLDFGNVDITSVTQITDTVCLYARIGALNDASGVFNMRFFLTSISDWGAGTYRFLESKQLHFQQGGLMLTASNNDTPTTVPSQANLSGTATTPEFQVGKPWMSGILDDDVSSYVYLAVQVGTDVDIGIKGGAGAGSFRYRLLYDFS